MAINANVIRNLAKTVGHEIERLNNDVVVHWDRHLDWLKMLAKTLASAAKKNK